MSFTVAQRTREIGIRTALGALPGSIVTMIARRAAIQLAVGVLLGIALAAALLAEAAGDVVLMNPQGMPRVVAAAVAGTVLVGVVACVLTTLRGIRIQPTEALREG